MFSANDQATTGGDWKFFDDNPTLGIRRYRLDLGDGNVVMRTEYYVTDALFTLNNAKQIESLNTPYGDGAVVASIPLNVLWSELGDAVRAGDDPHINRWLNDPDHAKFRTRGGRL